MGAAQSNEISCDRGECLNKAGHYKKDFLKASWAGTDRDGYRYSVSYAPTSTAACVGCKAKIAKGALRIGRSMPNPFDAENGASDYTKFMHYDHAFDVLRRSRCTSRVPLSTKDLTGFNEISAADKARVQKHMVPFAKDWKAKCATKQPRGYTGRQI